LNDFCIHRGLKVHSLCVQYLILLVQVHKNCVLYRFSSKAGYCYPPTKVYKERYTDCLNICETYDIFPEYKQYIKDKLSNLILPRESIFDTIEMPDEIRQLALHKI
jgi:hypothetical protein